MWCVNTWGEGFMLAGIFLEFLALLTLAIDIWNTRQTFYEMLDRTWPIKDSKTGKTSRHFNSGQDMQPTIDRLASLKNRKICALILLSVGLILQFFGVCAS
jgi:hypothetical protein